MNRVLVVATTEFLMLVRTKAFIIGILMLPIMLGLSAGFQIFAARHADVDDHRFAVIDHTGVLYDALAAAAAEHNAKQGPTDHRTGPYFVPERVEVGTMDETQRVTMSQQVRDKRLFAFVEVPASVLAASATKSNQNDQIEYYTETPSYEPLPNWLEATLGQEITERRFTAASVDHALITQLTRPARLTTLGLLSRKADGTVSAARESNALVTFVLPFGMMYLLFIALMSSAPQLLTAVVEEKMSRISEVLISSITPLQLMLGKLCGVAAVSTLLAVVYLGGGLFAIMQSGQAELIQPALIGWFLVYLLCAVLMFGSVFVAIGSACSDIKDSQSMMQPIMIFLFLPFLAAVVVLRQPNSTFSIILSMFPTASPFLMLLRLAMTPAPPLWQVGLSLVLTIGTAALFVWAAGKIFRIGLLMQGKPPNLPELFRWIRQ